MGGRRRDFDGQFAMLEIGFILDDPRIVGLSAGAFRYYVTAWCIAVKERRDTLPPWWDTAAITKRSSLDHRTGRAVHAKLLQKCLLAESQDGRIIVCGVKSKHPNLSWKGERINEFMAPHNPPQSESESESEKEAEAEATSAPVLDSPHKPIYETLRTVDARIYRDLQPTPAYENALAEYVARHGMEWVHKAARSMATYVTEQLANGAERRDKRHRPIKRLTDWLDREEQRHGNNGNRHQAERPTDRILREAREQQKRMAD